jgi:nitrite reductase (NO-forming)
MKESDISGPISTPTTRRDFLTRASLLGLGVPALGSILAGCGGEGEEHEEGEEHGGEAHQAARTTAVVPFQRYDPALPVVGPGRGHEFNFVARDATVAISSDAALRAWTFNGTVPGPVLHVRQGDTVRINLKNEGATAHSIDLHSAEIDPGTAFRSIAPGESLSYTFTPRYAGAFLYHCGTSPILLHIGSGMYGAIIVDPLTPLPPAREFVLVHSSFYVNKPQDGADSGLNQKGSGAAAGAQGSVTVYDPSFRKMLYSFPDYTAFNGYSYQYRLEPIRVKRGERVRFYVVNAGPTQDCAFHLVGGIFDTVYLGAPPGNTINGVQTFEVPAGGGMIFESMADIPGSFPFVNHKSGHGDKGATGLLVVEP